MSDVQPIMSPLPDYALAAPVATGQSGACAECGRPSVGLADASASGNPAAMTGFPNVYAVGRLEARFPNLGAEKEYAQLIGTDPDEVVRTGRLKDALSAPENRYLAREICWVFNGPSAESCVIIPRADSDLDRLLELLTDDADVVQALVGSGVVGVAPSPCLAPLLPPIWPTQLLGFGRDEFAEAIPGREEGDDPEAWRDTVLGLFRYLTERAENRGLSDEHRAMNYLALRYPPLYRLAFDAHQHGQSLIGVEPHRSAAGDRRVVDVRFLLRHARTTLTERYLCRVDVTDTFPFLTTGLMRTYD